MSFIKLFVYKRQENQSFMLSHHLVVFIDEGKRKNSEPCEHQQGHHVEPTNHHKLVVCAMKIFMRGEHGCL